MLKRESCSSPSPSHRKAAELHPSYVLEAFPQLILMNISRTAQDVTWNYSETAFYVKKNHQVDLQLLSSCLQLNKGGFVNHISAEWKLVKCPEMTVNSLVCPWHVCRKHTVLTSEVLLCDSALPIGFYLFITMVEKCENSLFHKLKHLS